MNDVWSHQKVSRQPQNIRIRPSALVVESSMQQGVGWPLQSNQRCLRNHEEVEQFMKSSVYHENYPHKSSIDTSNLKALFLKGAMSIVIIHVLKTPYMLC